MKKSLFAIAAVTAFAGAAQAQSSVTVYGILDVGYVGSNTKSTNGMTGVQSKTQNSQFGSGSESTSRLGFKGTEDLGGGTSAFFTVEMALNPTSPELSGSSTAKDSIQGTTNADGTFVNNRQSFVGIKQNGIGQVAIGRQYTGVFNAVGATNATQNNNITGSVLYPRTGVAGSGQESGTAFTLRASNAITFQSDSFAGFRANALYAMNNTNRTQTATAGGNTNWNGWGVGADYTWKKLYVTAQYQSFKTLDTFAVPGAATVYSGTSSVTSGVVVPTSGTISTASNLSDKQTYVGATYDFGILKAYAGWIGRKVQQDTAVAPIAAGEQVNRNAQQIGVRSFITPKVEAWGAIGTGKYKGAVGDATANFTGWQLGSNYLLSKRTNLYAIYGQTNTSSTSNTVGSAASNQYAVGVRHTF